MRVHVRFLATFKVLFAGRGRDVDVVPGASVRDLLAAIGDTPERRSEIFAGDALKPGIVIMRNGSPAMLDEKLDEGDNVAVFPFVTGG